MSKQMHSNVILFPKTIEYYQLKLTRMLESEQFDDAIALLQFLLTCETEDVTAVEEWTTLLAWLQSQQEERRHMNLVNVEDDDAEDGPSEQELYDETIRQKIASDQAYVEKLIALVKQQAPLEKKMLALDQLSLIDHPQIIDVLKKWLAEQELYPMIQFKILQTLRRKGAAGKITIVRCGEQAVIELEKIPLSFNDYPAEVREILEIVERVCEVSDPALFYFTEQIWHEFLASVYGTAEYGILLQCKSNEQQTVWAAALHGAAQEIMVGSAALKACYELYDISPASIPCVEEAAAILKKYIGVH